MKFIEKNKHRLIEKSTMELAMSWYYRYIEKEEQIEKIEKHMYEFESQMLERLSKEDKPFTMADFQHIWHKTINL
jgi:dihydroneopterin aldolase